MSWGEDDPLVESWGQADAVATEEDLAAAAESYDMLLFARKRLEESRFPNLHATAIGLGASVASPVSRIIGQGEHADFLNRFSGAYQQAAAERDPEGWVPPIIKRGARGVGQTLPTMIVGGAVAGPYGAIGAAVGQEMNQAVTEGKDAGLRGGELAAYVATEGVVEAVPAAVMQKFGLGGLESVVGRSASHAVGKGVVDGLKRAGIATLQEIPEEIVTELGHSVAGAVSGVQPGALEPEALTQTVADTTVQTLMTMGVVATPQVVQPAIDKIAQKVDAGGAPSRTEARDLGAPPEVAGKAPKRRQWFLANQERLRQQEEERRAARRDTIPDQPLPPAVETPAGELVPGAEGVGAPEDQGPAALPQGPAALPQAPAEPVPPAVGGQPEGRQGVREPRIAPEQHIREYAEEVGLDPDVLMAAAEEVHQGMKDTRQAQIEVKREAHRKTGLSGADMRRLENKGHDRRIGEQAGGKTGEKLRLFDAYAEELAAEYPEAFGTTTDPGEVLWDLLRQPASRDFRVDNPHVMAEAEAMVRGNNIEAPTFERPGPGQKNMFGPKEDVRGEPAPAEPPAAGQQRDLFSTKGLAGQKNLFPDTAVPDDMVGDDIESFFRVGAKKKSRGRKPITRQTIAGMFPGTKITPAENGWHIEAGDSFFTVEMAEDIEVDWNAVEQRIERPVPEHLRRQIGAAGAFSMTLPDGTKHNGLGLLRLSQSMADEDVLAHEAIHLAHQVGLFKEREWQSLVDAHAAGVTDPSLQEEKIALARESLERTVPTVWENIRRWIRRVLAKIGVANYQARDVYALMQEAGFWQRTGSPSQQVPSDRYALRGRPDLANPATAPEARELVTETDELRNQQGRPGVRSDADVEAEGVSRLEQNYQGERDSLLNRGRSGEQLSDTETVMAKKIVNREAATAMQSGAPKAIADAMALIESYRNTGAEQARAFRQRRDPVESPAERMARALSEAILTPPTKQRERRNRLRREGHTAAADKINADWAKKFQDLKERLKTLGVDVDNLKDSGYSRVKAAKALRTIAAAKASGWDKMYEWWNNAILSAPTTQAANLTGNFGHGTWRLTAERLMESATNLGLRRPEGAQFGEFKHMLAGVLPGLSRGASNFLLTWQTEMASLEEQLGRKEVSKIEHPAGSIKGVKGRIIRLPWRLLKAADDFAKSLIVEMEVGAYAYRIAKAEGKTGEQLQIRIAELSADIESQAWDLAYDSALEAAFQQKGGPTTQKIKQLAIGARKDIPGVRYLLPFVLTPTNIFATGVQKSPLGTLGLAKRMYNNYRDGKSVLEGTSPLVAQQLLVWAVVAALLGNDDDDPWITGAEGSLTAKDREIGYRTFPAMSVKIGDKWYSYSRLEPFATVLGLTVDGVNALKSGDPERTATVPVNSLVGQMQNKTWLAGVSDVWEAISAGDEMPEKIAKWASNFTTSWVPNVIRSAGREADSTYMNRRVWGKGKDWWRRLGRRTLQKTEVTTIQDYPIYDVWGRPAERSKAPVGSDWLYRVLVPVKNQEAKIFVADRYILNYNNENPEDERFPAAPTPYYRQNKKTIYMTEEQYAEFVRLAGEAARYGLENDDVVQLDPANPTLEGVEWINRVATKARSAVRERLKRKWARKDVELDPDKIGRQARRLAKPKQTGGQP